MGGSAAFGQEEREAHGLEGRSLPPGFHGPGLSDSGPVYPVLCWPLLPPLFSRGGAGTGAIFGTSRSRGQGSVSSGAVFRSPGPPSEPLPPNIHELLSGILAHLSSAAPLLCAQSSASPLMADPHPATSLPLSSPASQLYGEDSFPVSDVPPSEEELEPEVFPESWAPVPPNWQMSQVAGSAILLRRDRASQGEAAPVPGQEVCWGMSCHSPLPSWHFRPLSQATQPTPTLPLPSVDELSRSLSVLSLFAGLSPPSLSS
ncbi:hypothetical protein E2C01_069477 [Portunus trituberculatus]|uniref:Uncharacterized protein n=1 Tax=Portunus trituberculatus TaxID=210409 RepID=A0A5B7HUM4_PORTR|nr:hypothetical protein [Portunus trituberculatus]